MADLTWRVDHGDCLDVMRGMADASVDAVVSDPPYGLGFMGKAWDHGVPGVPFWVEALRVAKPGAHLLAFGGTRTFHRLAVAIEDAGWEVRDCFLWLYGTGFPKSHNLDGPHKGWGTALKPAWEPIIVARKPLVGTVAKNVGEFGTGALNINASRVPTDGGKARIGEASQERRYDTRGGTNFAALPGPRGGDPSGRWPANVILDEDAAAALDAQTGDLGRSSGTQRTTSASWLGTRTKAEDKEIGFGDSGGASRFFYVAKASRSERDAGLEAFPVVADETHAHGMKQERWPDGTLRDRVTPPATRANTHPTVKPIALMRYLCRLVTPPNGIVLDPFTGSGTTGVAALREGFRFVGIEKEDTEAHPYVTLARARIAAAETQPDLLRRTA